MILSFDLPALYVELHLRRLGPLNSALSSFFIHVPGLDQGGSFEIRDCFSLGSDILKKNFESPAIGFEHCERNTRDRVGMSLVKNWVMSPRGLSGSELSVK